MNEELMAFFEAQFTDLAPGTLVEYKGSMLAAHGLWRIVTQAGDNRYTLAHIDNPWERLNADKEDLTEIPTGGGSDAQR